MDPDDRRMLLVAVGALGGAVILFGYMIYSMIENNRAKAVTAPTATFVSLPVAAPAAPPAAPTRPTKCEIRYAEARAAAVLVFENRDDLDEWARATSKDDTFGAREAERKSGFRVFPGSKCLVLDTHYSLSRVRVLSGPHTGKAGWLATGDTVGGADP